MRPCFICSGEGEPREVTPDETGNPVERDRGVAKPAPCAETEGRFPRHTQPV